MSVISADYLDFTDTFAASPNRWFRSTELQFFVREPPGELTTEAAGRDRIIHWAHIGGTTLGFHIGRDQVCEPTRRPILARRSSADKFTSNFGDQHAVIFDVGPTADGDSDFEVTDLAGGTFWLAVIDNKDGATSRTIMSKHRATATFNGWVFETNFGAVYETTSEAPDATRETDFGGIVAGKQILGLQWDPGAPVLQAWRNGVKVGTPATSAATTAANSNEPMVIGAEGFVTKTNLLDAHVAELAIWRESTTLTDVNIEEIFSVANAFWGVY